MAITLGKDIVSLMAQRKLSEHTTALSRISERLSSGLRINHASDDAAGLAIASSLEESSRVYSAALRNVSDGISALSIADQATAELTKVVDRLSELSMQASNGVYSSAQRQALDSEAQQLSAEYNRIISTTQFNGIDLLSGGTSLSIQAGADGSANSRIDVSLGDVSTTYKGLGTFSSGTFSATTTQRLVNMSVADFNNDGISDVVAISDNGAGTQVFLANGNGTFKAGLPLGSVGNAVSSGDFNGDGNVDIAAEGSTSDVEIRLGNGDGTFKAKIGLEVGAGASVLSIHDLNRDGYDDLVELDGGGIFSVVVSNGNGTFLAPVSYVSSATHSGLVLADVDSDGLLDLLSGTGAGLMVFHGNGNGTFNAAVTITNSTAMGAISAGDMDGDGLSDLLVLDAGGSSSIAIMHGNGNGTFNSRSIIGTGYTRAALQDINGDNILDVVMGQTSAPYYARVSLGNGNGTFSVGATFVLPGGHMLEKVALGDTNNDGVPDLFVATYAGNTIDVLLQDSEQVAGLPTISLTSVSSALDALDSLTTTREQLSAARANIGASLSRLAVASAVIDATKINVNVATSRIMDADIAQDAAELVRMQILANATAALLTHRETQSQLALKLLSV